MDPKTQPLIGVVPDRSRSYSVDEERRLAENLTVLTFEVHEGGSRNRQANEELLCDFHRRLFDSVRDHAGVIRKRGFGTETLTFGPNRSPRREEVPDQLYDVFMQLQRGLQSFDQNPNHPQYEHSAIRLAAWTHAEVIRIHPFEDGNGRCSRLLLNWILVRLGLLPIAFEATRQEYCECLNHYFRTNDLQPFLDLVVRLYSI